MDRAVTAGVLEPQLVILDARRGPAPAAPVVPIGSLARYYRPTPTLTDYDTLLPGSDG